MGTPDGASSACHRLAVGQSLPEARLSGEEAGFGQD